MHISMERRSCCWPLMLCLMLAADISLLAFMHYQKEQTKTLDESIEISEIKIKAQETSIKDFELQLDFLEEKVNIEQKDVENLQGEMMELSSGQENKAKEVKACKDTLAEVQNAMTAVEKEKGDTDANFAAVKSKWNEEIERLKNTFQARSPLCDHLKEGEDAKAYCSKNETSKQ